MHEISQKHLEATALKSSQELQQMQLVEGAVPIEPSEEMLNIPVPIETASVLEELSVIKTREGKSNTSILYILEFTQFWFLTLTFKPSRTVAT